MNQIEKRAQELKYAVAAIGGKSLPTKAPRAITFVSRTESSPARDGAPGKDAVIDHEEIYQKVLERIKKEKSLVVSDLSDGQAFLFNGTKYKTHEMMHGGSSGAASGTQVVGEVVSGSGTAWTLAHAPTAGTLAIYGAGPRLKGGGADYTQVGTAVTTVNSFSTGDLLADYSYVS